MQRNVSPDILKKVFLSPSYVVNANDTSLFTNSILLVRVTVNYLQKPLPRFASKTCSASGRPWPISTTFRNNYSCLMFDHTMKQTQGN